MIKFVFKIGITLLLSLVILLATATNTLAHAVSARAASTSIQDRAKEQTYRAPVLIITSYNPDTRIMSDNLAAFMDVFRARGCDNVVAVETMNCKNLSEAPEWKQRMAGILAKYTAADRRPALIILMGQEAWAAYLAQTSEMAQSTPVMCGLGSDYTIELPNDSVNLAEWTPTCRDANRDFSQFNIVGGYLYHYDIEANLKLMRRIYPERHKFLFLSDNTFGGLIMQSYARREMGRLLRSNERVEWLDGRKVTVTDVTTKLRLQTDSTIVMIGTWRIDSTENYVMGNITHLLYEANPGLPAFSISSVGINDWAIGGCSPEYQVLGGLLARRCIDFLLEGKKAESFNPIMCMGSHYVFDYERLKEFGIGRSLLPDNYTLVHEPVSFIQEHLTLVVVTLIIILVLCVCVGVAVYYLLRIKHMNEELQLMSRDLIAAKEKAEEANRLKTSFLANMSHEIRTPLNAIVGFSGVLASEDVSEPERRQFSEIIRVNSDLLLHLINDILDLSRIEAGRMQFVSEDVEVVELCKTSLSTAEYARRTQAAFVFDSPLTRLRISTDGQRLQQVLINLLTNSAKFTERGFIHLKLRVNDDDPRMVVFCVEDTGCGIPPEKAEKVFERFEKLNEYAQGTGLGLSISKVIIENLGGRIWLDTSYNDGARFFFTLPLGEHAIVE